jgi:hypothetical protein
MAEPENYADLRFAGVLFKPFRLPDVKSILDEA